MASLAKNEKSDLCLERMTGNGLLSREEEQHIISPTKKDSRKRKSFVKSISSCKLMGVILPEISSTSELSSFSNLSGFLREGWSDDRAVAFGSGLGPHGPF